MTVQSLESTPPRAIRELCRRNELGRPTTAGLCDGFVQANLVVLPSKYADDLRNLCLRNPVPCPLLGETKPGDPIIPSHLAADCDVRTDLPFYDVYRDGKFEERVHDLSSRWRDDSVGFLIGCSYSFESALVKAGHVPRQIALGRNVPMYKTSVSLCPAGIFSGRMVVSMRPYKPADVEAVRAVSRPFLHAHGEPVAWGEQAAASLGIADLSRPDFGDPSEFAPGEVPVFWGCGVTPQLVAMDSKIPGEVFCHAPGFMLVLDINGAPTAP